MMSAALVLQAGICFGYIETPVTLSGFIRANGTFDATARYYDGEPLEDYIDGSGEFTETGSCGWQTACGEYYWHTESSTMKSLNIFNKSKTSGNAYMAGRNYDGNWTNRAYINSNQLEVTVNHYKPSVNPMSMPGHASIGCITEFNGYRWTDSDSAEASVIGSVGGTEAHSATLLIGQGGGYNNGDGVTMEIIFQSGERGYDFWELKIGGNEDNPFYHYVGGADHAEYFRTEIQLVVGTDYFFSYETLQSYSITTIGSEGQFDLYNCNLQMNVIPEPGTILLTGLGVLIIRKKK